MCVHGGWKGQISRCPRIVEAGKANWEGLRHCRPMRWRWPDGTPAAQLHGSFVYQISALPGQLGSEISVRAVHSAARSERTQIRALPDQDMPK
eukprot:364183-Chlamydomonas_euryale.AAC.25